MTEYTTIRIKKDLHVKLKLHCIGTGQRVETFVDMVLRKNKEIRDIQEYKVTNR